MLGLILLSIFVLVVLSIIIFEVRNERKYQEKRRQKRQKKKNVNVEKVSTLKVSKPKVELAPKVPHKEVSKKTKKLPNCIYPLFTHVRLIEMGLSDEEANEFVHELIPQLEIQTPLIEEAFKKEDFHQMERLTHSIKGSATNLGTGGVSDLLVECNTYLKTGTDKDIAKVYLDSLKHYTKTLKDQYT